MTDPDTVEFPILCETCLGENPYVRMTREPQGSECKICTRAFTVFRWQPGRAMRHKKTEICAPCARLKNVCQTCVLDLEHGLPVQARDAVLGQQSSVPTQPTNRRDYLAKLDAPGSEPTDFGGKAQPHAREQLRRMARTDPYYKRNRAHVCSFFVKGQCTRGRACPYRHEMPDGDPELARQNIADRYHGANDPVARRMLARNAQTPDRLAPPADASISSLFAMRLDPGVQQSHLHDHFSMFGELKSVVVVPKNSCAFVNFKNRAGAEAAALAARDGCVVNGVPVRLAWGRPRPKGPASEESSGAGAAGQSAATHRPLYPSQDPTAHGSSIAK
ncbi:Pre-mRNA-splicing factor slt11 [Coemansia erecta]|nr:Pre-mRNA-splicing factor slt11 [Coemansia sp. RSA 2618]KAJ2824280.1 Pre-mRNA-splicing factor slt11 [Coemansia erecta]